MALETENAHPSLKVLAEVLASLPRGSYAVDEGPVRIGEDVEYVVDVTPSRTSAASVVVFATPGFEPTLHVGRHGNRFELFRTRSTPTSADVDLELRQIYVAIFSGRLRDVVATRRRSSRVVTIRTEIDLSSGETIASTAVKAIWLGRRTTTVETYVPYADEHLE